MPLDEEVSLDISDALRQVDALEAALTSSATAFKVALAEALDVLQAVRVEDVDASAVTSSIDAAVTAADVQAEIEADASAVTTAIDSSVGEADKEVLLEPITSQITADIEAAIADADATIEVIADTSGAEADMQNLSETADHLGDSAEVAGEGIAGLAGGANLLAAGTRAAAGDTAGLQGAVGGLGGEAAGVVGILGALGFAAGVFVNEAIDADTATRRFKATFGGLGDEINHVNIGGLNEDLSALALRLGADDDKLREAASSIGQVGISSGKTKQEVAATAEQILVLAANVSAMNPQLGTADQIIGGLTNGLARGGRFLGQYGIALTSAEISARALADTGKGTAAELTVYEKSAAGAALATERLGDSIATNINEGADKPIVKLRALKQGLVETFEEAGAPLIEPLIGILEDLQPALIEVGKALGDTLVAGFAILGPLVKASVPLLQLFAFAVSGIADAVTEAAKPLHFLGDGMEKLADIIGLDSLGKSSKQFDSLGREIDETGQAVKTGDAAFDSLSATVGDTGDSFEDLAGQTNEVTDAINALIDAEIAYLDSTVAAEQAQASFSDALTEADEKLKALNEATAAHGAGSASAKAAQDEYNDAVRGARDAALQAAEAQLRLAEDTAEAEGVTLTSEERQATFRGTLVAMANQAKGPTRDAILGLLAELDKVSATRQANVTANVQPALTELGKVEAAVLRIRGVLRDIATGTGTANATVTKGPIGVQELLLGQDINGNGRIGAMAGVAGFQGPGVIETGERGRELVFVGQGQSATVLPGNVSAALKAQNAALQAELVATLRVMRNQAGTVGREGLTVEQLHVHEVTDDPRTTTFRIATELGELARR